MNTRDIVDSDDPYNLKRFLDAQQVNYDQAILEIRRGRKISHWMWYIFPQFEGLGRSTISRLYSIKSQAEAVAYLAHPILGERLKECAETTLNVQGKSAHQIFGSPDDMKLRSCATLFACVSPSNSLFHRILNKYFEDEQDRNTLRLLGIGTGW